MGVTAMRLWYNRAMDADWQPRLAGELLSLRPLAESDFEPLLRAASDPLIWEQHPDRLRWTRERFEPYFRSGLESRGALLILDRATGEVLGSSRYRDHKPSESSVEVGYTFLVRSCWGGAWNGELKRLMLDHAFRYVDTVVFVVGQDNRRSRRAVSKLGAVESGPVAGAYGASVAYRLAKDVWTATRRT